ncbi:tesmin isoform X3 [Pantherophis guttatus]|uniref:Tesmin isoform X3 n=1 Tax=Pantherophis guttatus TaxID=94885 RepID=A0A6P9BYB5_PANGU|nr:tesmin isoform X3 [Pantherophis guttatus]
MEEKRRESAEGEADTFTKRKTAVGRVSIEMKHSQSEILTVPTENHLILAGISRTDKGFAVSSENHNLKIDLLNKPVEKGALCSQDTCLNCTGETAVDHLKHTLNRENETAVLEVKMQSSTQDHCDEDLGKYEKVSEEAPSEAARCAYLPELQLHSYSVQFSSLMTQDRNAVLSLGTNTPDGTISTNTEITPVLRPLLTPSNANSTISCDQIKGIVNNSTVSQTLSGCSDVESCNGICISPQDADPVYDTFNEIKETAVSLVVNNTEEGVFHSSNGAEAGHNLAAAQNAVEEPTYSQRNYSTPQVIICQLKNGTHILCVNNTETRELKAIHLVPQYQEQSYTPLDYLISEKNCLGNDASNSVTSVLGQFLPVAGKLNTCAQELDNGSIHTSSSDLTLQEPTKLTLVGFPCASWDTKSKKPCNCTKSQCLKLYCDCFANGDFCSNCNCNNCYNNPEHEIERFKAIKACLDRNPEAFLPKIGKGKLGDIKPRHNKGCNCKRSGCLKNYCECFEAKIMCSSICKCIGCKNYEESPDRKTLMNMPVQMEVKTNEGNDSESFSNSEISKTKKESNCRPCRQPCPYLFLERFQLPVSKEIGCRKKAANLKKCLVSLRLTSAVT